MNTSLLSSGTSLVNPGISLLNPGTSLNFDIQPPDHQREEEEAAEDERKKQKELQELLSDAFDDLIDDDEEEEENDEDTLRAEAHDHLQINNHMKPRGPWPQLSTWASQLHVDTKTSTPLNQNFPPALKTPNTAFSGILTNEENKDVQNHFDHESSEQRFLPAGEEFTSNNQRQVLGNSNDPWPALKPSDHNHWLEANSQNPDENWENEDEHETSMTQRGEIDGGNEEFGARYYTYRSYGNNNSFAALPSQREFSTDYYSNENGDQDQEEIYQQELAQDRPEHYRVQYIPTNYNNKDENHLQSDRDGELEQSFIQAAGSNDERLLSQLQILYNVRGRKLDEINQEFEMFKQDAERDIRILKHRLAMVEGEKAGISANLSQAQDLLKDNQQENGKMQGMITALQTQIHSLSDAKEEVCKKFQISESTVDTLNQQLQELQRSENLVRAREQHDSIIRSLQQHHQKEITQVTNKFEEISKDRHEKTELVEILQKKLAEVSKNAERTLLDKAENINRLNRNLEDSQRHCQELIQSGSLQELCQLKVQIQQINAARNISESLCKSLQAELSELKEQLSLYESAVQLGVEAGSDSMLQLGIKKTLDWSSTPPTRSVTQPLSSEELVNGLKRELERCLSSNKSKRDQVNRLQVELNATKLESNEAKLQRDKAEDCVNDLKTKLYSLEQELLKVKEDLAHSLNGAVEQRHLREIKKLQAEKEKLSDEIQDLQKRLEEVSSNEEHLNEINRELNQQMVQMIHEFDEDKRTALEKCKKACLNLHENATKKWKEEMYVHAEEEKTKLIEEFNACMSDVQNQLQSTQKELDEVKELYVSVCEEKNCLEDKLNKIWENKIIQLKSTWLQEKTSEIENLTRKYEMVAKATTQAEKQEADIQSRLESELLKRKEIWMKEMEKAKILAIQEAEKLWKSRTEELIKLCVEKERNLWMKDHNAALKDVVMKEKQKWQSQAEADKLKSIQELQLAWNKTKEEEQEEDLNKIRMSLASEYEEKVKRELERAQLKWEEVNRINQLVTTSDEITRKSHIKEIRQLKQDLSAMKLERDQLNEKLMKSQEDWLANRQELLQQKDTERKKAVKDVEDKFDHDYRQFLSDHKDMLNKALKNAREKYQIERLELQEQYENELQNLRDKFKKLQGEQEPEETQMKDLAMSHNKVAQKIEEEWKNHLSTKEAEWLSEKEHLQSQHESDVKKQLKEANGIWTQNCQKRFALVMEEVIEKQKSKHAKEKQVLSHTIRRYEQLLEKKTQSLNELETKLHDLELEQGEDMSRPWTLEGRAAQEDQASKQWQEEKVKLQAKIRKCETELAVSEKQNLEETEKMQQIFKEKYSQKQQEYQLNLKSLEQQLQESKIIYENERRTVVQEHLTSMEAMKNKMSDVMKYHTKQIEDLRQEHLKEVNEMLKAKSKRLIHATAQTEDGHVIETILANMKKQYVEAVEKMRADVLTFVQETSCRTVQILELELSRERQTTAKRLRNYYLKCFHQILQNDGKECPVKKIDKFLKMKEAMSISPDFSSRKTLRIPLPEVFRKSNNPYLRVSPDDDSGLPRSHNSPDFNSASSRSHMDHNGLYQARLHALQKQIGPTSLHSDENKKNGILSGIYEMSYRDFSLPDKIKHTQPYRISPELSDNIFSVKFPREPRQYNPEPEKLSSEKPTENINSESQPTKLKASSVDAYHPGGDYYVSTESTNSYNRKNNLEHLSARHFNQQALLNGHLWYSQGNILVDSEEEQVFRPIRSESCFRSNTESSSHSSPHIITRDMADENFVSNSAHNFPKPKPLISRETQAPSPAFITQLYKKECF